METFTNQSFAPAAKQATYCRNTPFASRVINVDIIGPSARRGVINVDIIGPNARRGVINVDIIGPC